MHRIIGLSTLMCLTVIKAQAQQKDLAATADSINKEGKTLYFSEMASWYGTDVFKEKLPDKLKRAGGYLSYDAGTGMRNIFFSRGSNPMVLATMSFPYNDISAQTCSLDSNERKLSVKEMELYLIRQAALATTRQNKDSVFHFYKNTGTNLIPVIINKQKRVYVITSPQENDIMLLGNDYLLTFNNQNEVAKTQPLHKSLLSFAFKADSAGKQVKYAVHSHLPAMGEFITATDVCTLMLYSRFAGWHQHYVISKTYVSIWDDKQGVIILTMEAWKRINTDRQQRHPDKQQ